ncbi:hypothetical protein N7462_006066 [Penicillium macrosclerotiorum]|uniref:uncharacterized protein n=1 Tax=Penicillium macrosclerotiorum TaxID=303699 RepID=UPI002546DDE5|nr:uncharacterized protein N7462_006066 [Penicillium macrosclerotiorum]KAJ5682901.1 hypothetical protein N7462_006066 [Penicillium macrosclerotiorum]
MSVDTTLSKRRRFQTPITNFFPSVPSHPQSSGSCAVTNDHYSARTFSATPVVPAKIQANLLSVGMRVRKSVGDGYKTQLAMKVDKPPITAEAYVAQSHSGNTRPAELAPFSGLVKSSYDSQPTSDHVITDDGDAFSLPPSSQESTVSSVSHASAMNTQKRQFDTEDDSDDEAWTDAPVGRTIISPKLGLQRRHILAQRASSRSTMDLDDFGEAPFLCRREEVDADYAPMDCA